jgi:hypothetical protein
MGNTMDAGTRFAALEMACREQARAAQNDLKYWLSEADEWARLKNKELGSSNDLGPSINDPSAELEMLRDLR